jgi:hypothetical protein
MPICERLWEAILALPLFFWRIAAAPGHRDACLISGKTEAGSGGTTTSKASSALAPKAGGIGKQVTIMTVTIGW